MSRLAAGLAAPSNLTMVDDDSREVSFCEHCRAVVLLDPSDMRPNWYHVDTGSRICHAAHHEL
jgi:hypothetical protein